jgi:hypothetical protein
MKGLLDIREGDCTLSAIRGLYGPCGGLIWNKKFFLTSSDGVDMMKESSKPDGPRGREVNMMVSFQENEEGFLVAVTEDDFVFLPAEGSRVAAFEQAVEQLREWFYASLVFK